MDRVYQSSAVESPPEPVASSGSFPTSGNKLTGQAATVPGPYWFYSVTEEIRNAIIAAGMTPDPAQVNQLAKAFGKYLPLAGGNVTVALSVQGKTVVLSVNGIAADSNGNVSLGSLVKSVNGLAADASGNVTISVGGVEQKFNQTSSSVAVDGTTSVTITGLTVNKPLFLHGKGNTRNATFGGVVTSGAVLVGATPSHYFLHMALNETISGTIIPTATSVSLMFKNLGSSAGTFTLVAYQ